MPRPGPASRCAIRSSRPSTTMGRCARCSATACRCATSTGACAGPWAHSSTSASGSVPRPSAPVRAARAPHARHRAVHPAPRRRGSSRRTRQPRPPTATRARSCWSGQFTICGPAGRRARRRRRRWRTRIAAGILFEARHRRRDGSAFPVEVSSRGMTIGGERVLLSVIRDITERARAEQSLRESERRTTRGAQRRDRVDLAAWIVRRACCWPARRPTARLGLRRATSAAARCTTCCRASLAEARRRRFDEVVRTGEPVQFEDERAGMVFHHTFYPVRDAVRRVSGVAVFSRDHTARRRAEAEVERLNAQLRTRVAELERLLALTPVGVAIAEDPECRVMRANAALQRLLGVPAETQRVGDSGRASAVAHLPGWARALRRRAAVPACARASRWTSRRRNATWCSTMAAC